MVGGTGGTKVQHAWLGKLFSAAFSDLPLRNTCASATCTAAASRGNSVPVVVPPTLFFQARWLVAWKARESKSLKSLTVLLHWFFCCASFGHYNGFMVEAKVGSQFFCARPMERTLYFLALADTRSAMGFHATNSNDSKLRAEFYHACLISWFQVIRLDKFADWFACVTFVESNYQNAEMCKYESSQKAEPCRMIPRKLAANLELFNYSWQAVHDQFTQ